MNIKTLLIVGGPPALVVGAIAYLNPAILTWPVVACLSLVFGVFGGVSARIVDPK